MPNRRSFLSLLTGIAAVLGASRPRAAATRTLTSHLLPTDPGAFTVSLPAGAMIVSIGSNVGRPYLYVLADPLASPVTRSFVSVATDGSTTESDLVPIGSAPIDFAVGDPVLHVFKVI